MIVTEITITTVYGSSVPGCENTEEGCFAPNPATVEIGERVNFVNKDHSHHTFTAGIIEEGLTGEFGSRTGYFMPPRTSHYWISNVVREIPYFCMLHPWSKGVLIVKPKSSKKNTVELGIQTEDTSELKM